MNLDILAIAAHPDDVELACGGTLALMAQKGKKVGVLDLTRGELGTRGTPELREEEAKTASKILGLTTREKLDLGDGTFQNGNKEQLEIIKVLRKYRPKTVLLNAPDDRHPDHGRSAQLEKDACFFSGLKKIETVLDGEEQEAFRPEKVYHYIQDRWFTPHFVIDISEVWEIKMKAIMAYKSQFFSADYDPEKKESTTYISSPLFLEYLESRAKETGHLVGKKYGEGFLSITPLVVQDFEHLL